MSSQSTSSSSSVSSNSSGSSSDSSSSDSDRSQSSSQSLRSGRRRSGHSSRPESRSHKRHSASRSSSSSSSSSANAASSAQNAKRTTPAPSKQQKSSLNNGSAGKGSARRSKAAGGAGVNHQKSGSSAPRTKTADSQSSVSRSASSLTTTNSLRRHRAAAVEQKTSKSIFSPEQSSASDAEPSNRRPPATLSNKQTLKRSTKSMVCRRSSSVSSHVDSVDDTSCASDANARKSGSALAVASAGSTDAACLTRIKKEEATSSVSAAEDVAKPSKIGGTQSGQSAGAFAASTVGRQEELVKRRTRRTRGSRNQKRCRIYNTDSDSDTRADESPAGVRSRNSTCLSGATGGGGRPSSRCSVPERLPLMGEARCPVAGCDSWGHLSGLHDKHFTRIGCPQYHNTSDAETKDHQLEREIRVADRQKAIDQLQPGQSPSAEHKSYHTKVMSQRRKCAENSNSKVSPSRAAASSEGCTEREVDLTGEAPAYDVMLFKEAQATASSAIENEIRDLPASEGYCAIEMGHFEMEVWYQSPYPDDFAIGTKLFICEFCLKYLNNRTSMKRHNSKCVWRFPPGNEIYRHDKMSVFEVDGRRFKSYCQNLCLLAKLFLDNKTLYFDVEPFLFYVMTTCDSDGCHIVGYFSKEKSSFLNYNVSCILILPPYQRQGFGRLLIDFSYLLTRVEGRIGSPEKPLSDLGLISYRSYWKDMLLRYLSEFHGRSVSIKDISQEMAANANDIVSTLQAIGLVKYWKNKHIILKRQDIFEDFMERQRRRGSDPREIDPKCLVWKPFQPEKT